MLDRHWITELTVDDRVVLRVDTNRQIVDEQERVIARVERSSPKLPIRERTFCIRLNESVVDESLRKLGSVDGKLVRKEFGEIVAKTDGVLGREIGAAFLAFQIVPVDLDDPVIVYREIRDDGNGGGGGEPDTLSSALGRILLKLFLLVMGVILLVAFLLNTIFIWAGMLLAAAIVTSVFVRPETASDTEPPIPFTDQQIADLSSNWGIVFGCLFGAWIALRGNMWSCVVAIGGILIGGYALYHSGTRGVVFLRKRLMHRPAGGPFPPQLREFLVRKSKIAFNTGGVLLALAILMTARLSCTHQDSQAGSPPQASPSQPTNALPTRSEPVREAPQVQPPKTQQPAPEVIRPDLKSPSPDSKQPSQPLVKPPKAPPISAPKMSDVGDLAKLSPFELKCMRNEPYARHGYIFKGQDLADFFKKQSWYKPATNDQTLIWKQLSQADKDMINRVKAEEARRTSHH